MDTHATQRAKYAIMERALRNGLHDLRILSSDIVGPSDASWQDIAGTASTNFQVLANQLMQARLGNHESFLVFPSPSDALDEEDSHE